MGHIGAERLCSLVEPLCKNVYGQYLLRLLSGQGIKDKTRGGIEGAEAGALLIQVSSHFT